MFSTLFWWLDRPPVLVHFFAFWLWWPGVCSVIGRPTSPRARAGWSSTSPGGNWILTPALIAPAILPVVWLHIQLRSRNILSTYVSMRFPMCQVKEGAQLCLIKSSLRSYLVIYIYILMKFKVIKKVIPCF